MFSEETVVVLGLTAIVYIFKSWN